MSSGKKIAIVGCSYSSYEHDGEINWTYKLSTQYPNHYFYNYSKGGTGVDYMNWALLDIKKSINPDLVILTKAHTSRASFFVGEDYEWEHNKITNNLTNVRLGGGGWATVSSDTVMLDGKSNPKLLYKDTILSRIYTSLARISYNEDFLNNVTSLYNFPKIKLYDFSINGKIQPLMIRKKLTVSKEDDHWTSYGHSFLLKNFILDQELLDFLK